MRYLIVVDAHSKWIEAVKMRGTDAKTTINVLRTIFARFGLPSQLVTDNGPPFSSQDFNSFCEKNTIKHVTSAPYRPQGNGAAENAVKTIKKCLKRASHEGEDPDTALSKFLLQYRNCEHATTGVAPAVALLGRRLRSRLDALRPDTGAVVRDVQERRIARTTGTDRQFQVGDAVLARDYTARGGKWAEGKVVKVTGPVSYKVEVGHGAEWRRHADQMVPATSKNRYSLSRVTERLDGEMKGDLANKEADGDMLDDACGGADDGAEELQGSQESSQQAPRNLSPPSPTSAPPSQSDRALRAINRAERAKKLKLM